MHQNVLVANGAAFFPGEGYPAMRLNFSHTPEEIQIGMKILGQLLAVLYEKEPRL
jgi:DNA-binding transcriptional MocR family regulator